MSRSDRLGVLGCLLAFGLICALAIVLSTQGPFGGLQGAQRDLADKAAAFAPNESVVTAAGQNITVALPAVVPIGFDRAALEADVASINGVRNVSVVGSPVFAGATDGDPDPVEETTPESESTEPEPTEPEPVADEPTPEPEPTSEAISAEEILDRFDLGGVQFVAGTPQLTGVDETLLDTLANQLVTNVENLSDITIEVQAHTDNVGDPDVNQLLTEDRAQAVADYLANNGVNATLIPRGYGGSTPIADNSTDQGRDANQRVALVVEGN